MTGTSVRITWRRPTFKRSPTEEAPGPPRTFGPSTPTHRSCRAATDNCRFITDWFHAFHASPSMFEAPSARSPAAQRGPTPRNCSAKITVGGGPVCQVCDLLPPAVRKAVPAAMGGTEGLPDLRTLRVRVAKLLGFLCDGSSRFVALRHFRQIRKAAQGAGTQSGRTRDGPAGSAPSKNFREARVAGRAGGLDEIFTSRRGPPNIGTLH